MTLTITINMDGAAFEDYAVDEVNRILTKAGERVRMHAVLEAGTDMPLYDTNGNKCGSLTVTETEEN